MESKHVILGLLLLALAVLGIGQEYYFYQPDIDFGSETVFNPFSLLINGSYDILRNDARTKNIFAIEYGLGFENVLDNITDPLNRIQQFGTREFLAHEVLPLEGYDAQYVQYWPNYATHLVGNGMQFVKISEWYHHRGYSHPRLWGGVTTTIFQVMNEVVEHSSRSHLNVDAIADILIFNPLGFALFSLDAPKRFFSDKINLIDWSLQPMIDPFSGRLENAGQQFAVKYPLPWINSVRGFAYWGIQGLSGLSWSLPSGDGLSVAGGVVANSLVTNVVSGFEFMSANLDGALGIFFDRQNSLLWSAIITGPGLVNLRVNIFPGVINTPWGSPGLYCAVGRWDGFILGINLPMTPIGLQRRLVKPGSD